MDIELTNPEYFPPEAPIRPLEAMEQARQAHLSQELFDRLVEEGRHEQVAKVGKFMQRQFSIDLSNK
jgi:hypothetical protein